jgi:uncharacterized RDD family membrane protein YckC
MAYEALLVLGVLALAFMVPQLAISAAIGRSLPGWLLLAHVFLVLLAYFLWFWHRAGQTLAMKTWKIRLVDATGRGRPTLRQLLLRYLLAWPSILFYGAGLVWAFFDRDRQFIHDRLAGTRLEWDPPRR